MQLHAVSMLTISPNLAHLQHNVYGSGFQRMASSKIWQTHTLSNKQAYMQYISSELRRTKWSGNMYRTSYRTTDSKHRRRLRLELSALPIMHAKAANDGNVLAENLWTRRIFLILSEHFLTTMATSNQDIEVDHGKRILFLEPSYGYNGTGLGIWLQLKTIN